MTENVFLLGTPYCGSTILGTALDAHKNISYVGETSRLPKFQTKFNIGPELPTDTCQLCAIENKKECPVLNFKLRKLVQDEGEGRLFDSLRQSLNSDVIIDGSKSMRWLHTAINDYSGPQPKAIICSRSPFAFVDSMLRNPANPKPAWHAANEWRDTYIDVFRSLHRLNYSYINVRYDDFSVNLERTLRRLSEFLNVEFQEKTLEVDKHKLHALGGNIHAYAWNKKYKRVVKNRNTEIMKDGTDNPGLHYRKKTSTKFRDEKWLKYLNEDSVRTIVDTPGLVDVATWLGYDMSALIADFANNRP